MKVVSQTDAADRSCRVAALQASILILSPHFLVCFLHTRASVAVYGWRSLPHEPLTKGMPCTQCEVFDVGKYSHPSYLLVVKH